MNRIPIWFGRDDRPLFGWLNLPERARSGAVLCRPIGAEEASSHRAFRCLAENLANLGVVTLEFDYTGTGDSAGDITDVVSTTTWVSDIRTAITYVRQTGIARVGLVGLRLGATLAATSADRNDIHALVLWDPCDTGKHFLREQRMLAAAMGTTPTQSSMSDGKIEIPGLLLPAGLAGAISSLSLEATAAPLAQRVLLLARPDRPSSPRVLKRLATENIEHGPAAGQEQFIDVEPGSAVMPERVIADITSWLSRTLNIDPVADIVPTQPESCERAVLAQAIGGPCVIEHCERVGSDGLFGIVSEPQGADNVAMPAVVLLNAGMLPHSGPARVWVEMARTWATHNVRVLRFDLGGLGDSPTRPGHPPDVAFPPEATDDLINAARFMAPDDPAGVVPVGLCSGGYHILEAALSLHFREAWLINPNAPRDAREARERRTVRPHQEAVRPLNQLTQRLRENAVVARVSTAILPAAAWWVLDKTRLFPSLAGALETAVANGTQLLVIYAKPEFLQFEKRSRWPVRRLERSGCCHFKVANSADHSLFDLTGRSEVTQLLTAQVLQKLVPDFTRLEATPNTDGSPTGHTTRTA